MGKKGLFFGRKALIQNACLWCLDNIPKTGLVKH